MFIKRNIRKCYDNLWRLPILVNRRHAWLMAAWGRVTLLARTMVTCWWALPQLFSPSAQGVMHLLFAESLYAEVVVFHVDSLNSKIRSGFYSSEKRAAIVNPVPTRQFFSRKLIFNPVNYSTLWSTLLFEMVYFVFTLCVRNANVFRTRLKHYSWLEF